MNQPSFKRARTPEAKAERSQAILAAAQIVLGREGVERTTLSAIASEAGVVKSNIYRYFESREEILMRLMVADLSAAQRVLKTALAAPLGAAEVAGILAAGLAANPRLCLLISLTATTLERNISTNTLRDIKHDMVQSLEGTAHSLRQCLPALSQAEAEHVGQLLFTLVAGLWPASSPGPALQSLYGEPEFARFDVKFEPTLRAAIFTVLNGVGA